MVYYNRAKEIVLIKEMKKDAIVAKVIYEHGSDLSAKIHEFCVPIDRSWYRKNEVIKIIDLYYGD